MIIAMLPSTTGARNWLCIDDYTNSPWMQNASTGENINTIKDSGIDLEYYCDGAMTIGSKIVLMVGLIYI